MSNEQRQLRKDREALKRGITPRVSTIQPRPPDPYQVITILRQKAERIQQSWLQERGERMRLQEEVVRMKEQNEQLIGGLNAVLRGRWDMSKVVNMRLLEMAEAAGGILNAWKMAKKKPFPWTPVTMLIGFATLLGFIALFPDLGRELGGWFTENNWAILLLAGLVALVLIFYFRRRGSTK